MNTLRLNIFANIAAKVASSFLMLLTIPILIRMLGAEAYGLAVLFSTAISIASNFDFGLSTTLNRELATGGGKPEKLAGTLSLITTLEVLFWAAALAGALFGIFAAPVVVEHWLVQGATPVPTTITAMRLLIAAAALQFPFTLYAGGLQGLQRQVALSAVITTAAAARTLGTLLALAIFGSSLETYFWCQLAINAMQALATRQLFWNAFAWPKFSRRFDLHRLQQVKSFSLGMTGISISGILLTQMDKIVISHFLSLREVAYYGIASTVAAAMGILASPIFNALFPRLTQAVSENDRHSVSRLYHRGSQLLSVFIYPLACLLLLYPQSILLLWTGDAELAKEAAPVLALLSAGAVINATMHLPHALMLAEGWTSLTLRANLMALALLIPVICVAASVFGLLGAAIIWPILNLAYFIFVVHFMHQRLLPDDKWPWYFQDIGLPLLVSLGLCMLSLSAGFSMPQGLKGTLAFAGLYAATATAALLASPGARKAATQIVEARLGKRRNG